MIIDGGTEATQEMATEGLAEVTKFETCTPTQVSSYIVNEDSNCIMFLPCGVISFNHKDVERHYCARCHRFIIKNFELPRIQA